MKQIQLGDQLIRYDREQTAKAYSSIKTGAAEQCGCERCRIFAAHRTTIYSDHFLKLLERLGIDASKESDVHEWDADRYGGWFYVLGEVVKAGERMTEDASGLRYFFRPARARDFGEQVIALEFIVRVRQPS
jgi:hypothetical protein